jgi:hypothetical protein
MRSAASSGGAAGGAGASNDTDAPEESDELDELEAVYRRVRRTTYKTVGTKETTVLTLRWGPTVDVLFDPKNAPGSAGGTVRIYARTPGGQIEIARATIANPPVPLLLTASAGCDHYVVTATLGSAPPAGSRSVDCYAYACSYAGK